MNLVSLRSDHFEILVGLPNIRNLPVSFVPGSVRCSSALCLFVISKCRHKNVCLLNVQLFPVILSLNVVPKYIK